MSITLIDFSWLLPLLLLMSLLKRSSALFKVDRSLCCTKAIRTSPILQMSLAWSDPENYKNKEQSHDISQETMTVWGTCISAAIASSFSTLLAAVADDNVAAAIMTVGHCPTNMHEENETIQRGKARNILG
jgi:hypothetical protein